LLGKAWPDRYKKEPEADTKNPSGHFEGVPHRNIGSEKLQKGRRVLLAQAFQTHSIYSANSL
jgi:hypothetical protein